MDTVQDVGDGVRGRPARVMVATKHSLASGRGLTMGDSTPTTNITPTTSSWSASTVLKHILVSSIAVRVRRINRIVQRVRVHNGSLSAWPWRQLMMVVVVMHVRMMRQVSQFVAQYPRNRTDTGHVRFIADVLAEQSIPDLPCEDSRVLLFQLANVVDHLRGSYARLGSTDGTRQNWSRFVVTGQNLWHASMADAELSGDITGPDAKAGQVDDLDASLVWKRSPVDEKAAELVHFAVLLRLRFCKEKGKIFVRALIRSQMVMNERLVLSCAKCRKAAT